ncbi:MAG: methyltransferase domain-containing protein [Bernardetiaceae bacterium]|nr:methyltransferase domain-containing protein [Bernardetiaceae bacterium]
MPNFSQRSSRTELMDDLNLAGDALAQNLRELRLVNRYLGGNEVLYDALKKVFKRFPGKKKWRILDVGSGGGDLIAAASLWAEAQGIAIEWIGVDANPFMVEYATLHTKGTKNAKFITCNIFDHEFENFTYDLAICSLFCHHFKDEELVRLFKILIKQSDIGFVINDLHRHPLAYYSIWVLTRLFRGSYLVKHDAPVSVLRAFRRQELEQFLVLADIQDFSLSWKWAFRYQVIAFKTQK